MIELSRFLRSLGCQRRGLCQIGCSVVCRDRLRLHVRCRHRQADRIIQHGLRCQTVVSRVTDVARAGERGQRAIGVFQNAVAGIGDVNGALGIHQQSVRMIQGLAGAADPDDGGKISTRDFPHQVIHRIGHVDVAGRIHSNPGGSIQHSIGRRPAIAGTPKVDLAGPGYGRNDPRGIHLAQAIVAGIRDVQIPRLVHGQTRQRV